MSSKNLQLGLRDNQKAYLPGEEIGGAAHWELDRAPRSAEVRLCWFTRGKGTEDSAVVETIHFDAPQQGDVRTFAFRAPAEPYSFSGKLISLIWCVELVIQPGDLFERLEITLGPQGKEVLLLGR